jgi:hypothetical protein
MVEPKGPRQEQCTAATPRSASVRSFPEASAGAASSPRKYSGSVDTGLPHKCGVPTGKRNAAFTRQLLPAAPKMRYEGRLGNRKVQRFNILARQRVNSCSNLSTGKPTTFE